MTKNSKLLKVLVVLALFGSQNIALAQQFNQKFDTKNHPKAKGVWAQVSYPDGWVAKQYCVHAPECIVSHVLRVNIACTY